MSEIEWLGGERRRQIIEDFRKPQSGPHMLIGGEAAMARSGAVEVFELPVRAAIETACLHVDERPGFVSRVAVFYRLVIAEREADDQLVIPGSTSRSWRASRRIDPARDKR